MVEYIIAYLLFCAYIGHLGSDRRLGFWGYFFFSIIITPVIGLVLVFASDPIHPPGKLHELTAEERAAIEYAREQLVRGFRERIDRLIQTGRITRDYAERELAPLLKDLRRTAQFGPRGPIPGTLDAVLRALEPLPASDANRTGQR